MSSPSSSHHRRLPPLNIMHSLSLCRKSRPTCTLSLAHVSACRPQNTMQVELDLSTIHFVAVPVSPVSPKSHKRTPTKSKSTTTPPNDINVIPFPTSTQTTQSQSNSASTPVSHPTVSSKRHQVQKKQDSPISTSASPPRKRARKGSLSPPGSSRSSTPSPRVKALVQRVPPTRPPTPTPDSRPDAIDDVMSVGLPDKAPVQQQPSSADPLPDHQKGEKTQGLEKHGHPELPPYSPSPPPYSPPVVAPMPVSSPTPIPLHVPIPVVPISSSSSPSSSSNPSTSTTTSTTPSEPSRPLPTSSPPPSSSSSSPLPPPTPSRKSRLTSSELRFFIYLYRTVVSGLEMRQKARLNTQQVRRARDGSRREQHLDGVLIEVDDDDDEVDAGFGYDPMNPVTPPSTPVNEPSASLNEDLEVQDALLAVRLRGFLKWNGVEEWMLKVDPSSPSSPTSSLNPFLEDEVSTSPDKMDVDVQSQREQEQEQTLPMLSSRHLITVLRMRGSCGSRQSGPIGLKFKKNKSKLRMCAYEGEGDD